MGEQLSPFGRRRGFLSTEVSLIPGLEAIGGHMPNRCQQPNVPFPDASDTIIPYEFSEVSQAMLGAPSKVYF